MNIIEICKTPQEALKIRLEKELTDLGYTPISADGFIFAQGTHPVLLVAHMDTVHHDKCTIVCASEDGKYLMSPQGIGGDDRCGIYMILKIIKDVRCSVIFTEDEESGCVGARKFCKTKYAPDNVNYIIEFDRKGKDDAVFYDCDNKEFEAFITNEEIGFKTEYGSCSDISHIAEHLGLAAVNLSSGYYSAHTQGEFINMTHVENNIIRAKKLIESDTGKFEYVKKVYSYSNNYWYERRFGSACLYDSYDYDWYKKGNKDKKDSEKCIDITPNKKSDTIPLEEPPSFDLELTDIIKRIDLMAVSDGKCYLKGKEDGKIKKFDVDNVSYSIDKEGTVYYCDDESTINYPLKDSYKIYGKDNKPLKYDKNKATTLPWAYYDNIEKINEYTENLRLYDYSYGTDYEVVFSEMLIDAMYSV